MPRKQSVKSLEAQIEKLQRRVEEMRAREKQPVVEAILGAIRQYRILPEDLGISAHSRGPWEERTLNGTAHRMRGREPRRRENGVHRPARAVAPKYRHPETGETWSGRGRTARWLAEEEKNGKRREDFLIA